MFPINAVYTAPEGRSMGTRAEILDGLARVNIGPERVGDPILHGPGVVVSLAPEADEEIKTVLIDETGQIERELAQLSLDRIELVFPDWQRIDENPSDDPSADTDDWGAEFA